MCNLWLDLLRLSCWTCGSSATTTLQSMCKNSIMEFFLRFSFFAKRKAVPLIPSLFLVPGLVFLFGFTLFKKVAVCLWVLTRNCSRFGSVLCSGLVSLPVFIYYELDTHPHKWHPLQREKKLRREKGNQKGLKTNKKWQESWYHQETGNYCRIFFEYTKKNKIPDVFFWNDKEKAKPENNHRNGNRNQHGPINPFEEKQEKKWIRGRCCPYVSKMAENLAKARGFLFKSEANPCLITNRSFSDSPWHWSEGLKNSAWSMERPRNGGNNASFCPNTPILASQISAAHFFRFFPALFNHRLNRMWEVIWAEGHYASGRMMAECCKMHCCQPAVARLKKQTLFSVSGNAGRYPPLYGFQLGKCKHIHSLENNEPLHIYHYGRNWTLCLLFFFCRLLNGLPFIQVGS